MAWSTVPILFNFEVLNLSCAWKLKLYIVWGQFVYLGSVSDCSTQFECPNLVLDHCTVQYVPLALHWSAALTTYLGSVPDCSTQFECPNLVLDHCTVQYVPLALHWSAALTTYLGSVPDFPTQFECPNLVLDHCTVQYVPLALHWSAALTTYLGSVPDFPTQFECPPLVMDLTRCSVHYVPVPLAPAVVDWQLLHAQRGGRLDIALYRGTWVRGHLKNAVQDL